MKKRFNINKCSKIINTILILIISIILLFAYKELGYGIAYFIMGILPFSIILGGFLACFFKEWYFIIIPYTAIILYECIIKNLNFVVALIFMLSLISYIYLNHTLCFKINSQK